VTGTDRPARGPYEVHALRYATRKTLASEVYLNWFLFGEDDREIVMDYYCWLVRGSGRTILVDTGFTPEVGSRRGRTTTTPPLQGLAQLGVEPGDVDTVVITHAHYDHTGHVARFAHADIVIARRELDFWTGPYARRQQFAHSGEPDDIAVLAERDRAGRVTAVTGEYEVAPGVVLREVGGHTPGQLVAVVEAEHRRVVLASDAVHYYEELERDRPFVVVADLEQMYRGFDTVSELAGLSGSALVAGHDPDVMNRFPPSLPDKPDLAVRVG
jgi:glyoxylase-like metal-dependent hydrolase (beta-lactamase superfamily II)